MFSARKAMIAASSVMVLALAAPTFAEDYEMTTPIAPGIASPGFLETSIGLLRLDDGVPTEWTADKIYDTLDRSRALLAYLLGIPIVNQVSMRTTLKEYGPVNTTVAIWEELVDSRTVELTANDNVVYTFVWLDTRDGPTWPPFRQSHPAQIASRKGETQYA